MLPPYEPKQTIVCAKESLFQLGHDEYFLRAVLMKWEQGHRVLVTAYLTTNGNSSLTVLATYLVHPSVISTRMICASQPRAPREVCQVLAILANTLKA